MSAARALEVGLVNGVYADQDAMLADVTAIAPKLAPADAPRPVGAPTEIYTRVARGILTCWFGPGGP